MITNKHLYLTGSAVTFFGDALYTFVISWWLVQLTGDTKLIGLVLGIGVFPAVLLILLTGNLIDQFDNKIVMVVSDLISGIVCISAYFMIDTKYQVLTLIITTFFLFFFTNIFTVSSKSIVKFIFTDNDLNDINSYHTFIKQISKIMAPILGGILLLYVSPKTFILINGISFCIVAILESQFKYIIHPVKKAKNNIWKLDGFKLIKEQKLYDMILFIMINNFFMASVTIFIPYIVIQQYNSSNLLGLILTLQAIGALSATLFINKIKYNLSYNLIAILASFSLLLCSYNILMIGIGILLYGLFVTWFNIQFITELQIKTPNEIIGRVFSILVSMSLLLVPISNLFFGYFGSHFKEYGLVIVGIILIIVNIIFWFISQNHKTKNII